MPWALYASTNLTKYCAQAASYWGSSVPLPSRSLVFIQAGGLQGVPMILSSGLSFSASCMAGMM